MSEYFQENEPTKYSSRTALFSVFVRFEGLGSAIIIQTDKSNLWKIEFKGIKQPECLQGLYTSINPAERALREYIDQEGIKVKDVYKSVAHDDYPHGLPV